MRFYYFIDHLLAALHVHGIVPDNVLQLLFLLGQTLRKHNVLQRHKGNDIR